MPVKANRKLKEMVTQNNQSVDHARHLSEEIHEKILTGLQEWDPTIEDFDPLIEIAKLAKSGEDENTRLRANDILGHYMYPQIGRVEIKSQEDKNINIQISISGYAKSPDSSPGSSYEEPEDIEIEGDIDAERPHDYTDHVLKSLPKSREDKES